MDLLFAWIASLASAVSPIIIKLTSNSLVKSPWLFNIFWSAFAIPFVAALAFYLGLTAPTDWLVIFYASLSLTGFLLLYTTALYKLDVSTIAPLFSLRMVFAVLLGIIFLGETISTLALAIVAIIILASPFASYTASLKLRSFLQTPVLLAITSMFFLALVGYFTNVSVESNGYAGTILWTEIITLLCLLPTAYWIDFESESITWKSFLPFILLGISSFVYIAASTEAYARNLALSSIIVSLPLSMIIAVIIGRFVPQLKETHSFRVYLIRFSAAAVMVAGAIYLSFM